MYFWSIISFNPHNCGYYYPQVRKLKHREVKVPGSPPCTQSRACTSEMHAFLLTWYSENCWLHELRRSNFRVCTLSLYPHHRFSKTGHQTRNIGIIHELGRNAKFQSHFQPQNQWLWDWYQATSPNKPHEWFWGKPEFENHPHNPAPWPWRWKSGSAECDGWGILKGRLLWMNWEFLKLRNEGLNKKTCKSRSPSQIGYL